MNSSPTITKIAVALLKAQSEMSNAKKDAVNPFFKKSYADLNAIREAVLPVLNTNGISAIQPTCMIDGVPFVETILLHESGEFISSLTQVVVDKINDAQRHGSGLSYARRYALQSIVNIGAEDDDANGATKPLAAGKQQETKSPVKLPALNKKGFDEAITRIKKGETEVVQKLKDTFTLSAEQLAELAPFEAVAIVEPA